MSWIMIMALLTFQSCNQTCNQSSSSISKSDKISIWDLIEDNDKKRTAALTYFKANWDDDYTIQVIEWLYLTRDRQITKSLLLLLEDVTGQNFGQNMNHWYVWLWQKEEHISSDYGDFKGLLHSQVDPRFEKYFRSHTHLARIRMDEIRWRGVIQDGIPPLRNPKMIEAQMANYLEDNHMVFGIEVNGDARAYPKRILA